MITMSKIAANVPTFEELLVKMMPTFKFFAEKELKLTGDNYDECIQDLTCMALDNYSSLVNRGLYDRIFYTPIMQYAIKHYRDGRHFVGSDSVDLLSDRTRLLERCKVCSLDRFDVTDDSLHFMADPKANVSRIVGFKIDFFETWLVQQTQRDQEIIKDLARSETTNDVAKKYGVSAGLISQYRRRYADSWYAFNNPPEKTDWIEELRKLAAMEAEKESA